MSVFKERFARGGLMRLQLLPKELINEIILLSRPTKRQVVINPRNAFFIYYTWLARMYAFANKSIPAIMVINNDLNLIYHTIKLFISWK